MCIRDRLKGILKVLSVKLGAVRPFKTVTHCESPSKTVFAYSLLFSLTGLNLVVLINYEKCLIAVSYTHLDVYKRQV